MKRKMIAVAALVATTLITVGGTVAATTDDAGRGVYSAGRGVK